MVSNISDIKVIKELNREQIIDLLIVVLSFEVWNLGKIADAVDEESLLISLQIGQSEKALLDKDIKKLNRIFEKILQNVNKHKFIINSKLQDILEI